MQRAIGSVETAFATVMAPPPPVNRTRGEMNGGVDGVTLFRSFCYTPAACKPTGQRVFTSNAVCLIFSRCLPKLSPTYTLPWLRAQHLPRCLLTRPRTRTLHTHPPPHTPNRYDMSARLQATWNNAVAGGGRAGEHGVARLPVRAGRWRKIVRRGNGIGDKRRA